MKHQTKATFMSGPRANAETRRTWLIKIGDELSAMVRVYPDGDDDRRFICDCGETTNRRREACRHIKAAIKADHVKFF